MTRPSLYGLSPWLAPMTLGLALCLVVAPSPAMAQQEEAPAAEGEGSGRPFDGYFATGILAGLALFVIAKSARR